MSGMQKIRREICLRIELSFIQSEGEKGSYYLRMDYDDCNESHIGVMKDKKTALAMAHYIQDAVLNYVPPTAPAENEI